MKQDYTTYEPNNKVSWWKRSECWWKVLGMAIGLASGSVLYFICKAVLCK